VQAVEHDLQQADASADVLASLRAIRANEAEVHLHSVTVDGATKKRASRSVAQEALRAEIEKDAVALGALKPAAAALARRKVDSKRLARLATSARALAGGLGDRALAKGAAKTATQAERAAVAEQTRSWGACYRLLAALGRKDERVRLLLAAATAHSPRR
jgi:hypothetical protein